MPVIRCDYDVKGDLVLPNGADDIELSNDASNISITLRNGTVDGRNHVATLIAVVIGSATSADEAERELRSTLAAELDLLSFATHSRFEILRCRRQIDWEPYQKKRSLRIFSEQDARYPPEREMDAKFASTVQSLSTDVPAFARGALKYFRYGLLEQQPDDQFMRLWQALEIVAENRKERNRIPVSCPVCRSSLRCDTCGVEPTRVPMAKQAIDSLIQKIVGLDKSAPIAKRQFAARNGLVHGRSLERVERECGRSMPILVNELAALTWHAIMLSFPASESPRTFGHRGGDFSNGRLAVAAHLVFAHDGEGPHPAEANIPDAKVEIISELKSQTDAILR